MTLTFGGLLIIVFLLMLVISGILEIIKAWRGEDGER